MSYTTPDLPYAYDALEPFIDAKTMEVHHDKHHVAYTTKTNTALEKYPELTAKPIEEILAHLDSVPEDIRTTVKNNGGGHYHHSFLWPLLKKNEGAAPMNKLGAEINKKFGSFNQFQHAFEDAAATVFGSGWAWLTVNPQGDLDILKTSNQDSPLTLGHKPIIAIDVWEHAYYLNYQNRRPEYIEAYWHIINWDQAEQNFSS